MVYRWCGRTGQSVLLLCKKLAMPADIMQLTEHLATSSKVSAPCVADLAVDAIFLAAHMLLPRDPSCCCVRVNLEVRRRVPEGQP